MTQTQTHTAEAGDVTTLREAFEVPAAGTEDRDFWLEAAVQHGFEETAGGEHLAEYDPPAYFATEDEVLALMASCRAQGRKDALAASPAPRAPEVPEELRRLSEAATPGEWKQAWWGNEAYPFPLSIVAENEGLWVARDGTTSYGANGALMVAAVNFVRKELDTRTQAMSAGDPAGEGEVHAVLADLIKRWDLFRASDANHECAFRFLTEGDAWSVWDRARAILVAFTTGGGR